MRLECQARVQAVFTWAEFAKSLPAGTSKPATSEKLAKGLIIVKTCLLANFFLNLTLDLPQAFMFVEVQCTYTLSLCTLKVLCRPVFPS